MNENIEISHGIKANPNCLETLISMIDNSPSLGSLSVCCARQRYCRTSSVRHCGFPVVGSPGYFH